MTAEFDFDRVEAEWREAPPPALAERAQAEYDFYKAELELGLQRAAVDLLDDILGISPVDAKDVRTVISDVHGGGVIYMTVDGIELKVTLSETSDPMLHGQCKPTHGMSHWTPVESLLELGLKLSKGTITRTEPVTPSP